MDLREGQGTHDRFQRFQQSLMSWIVAKHYAVPYQVDGPKLLGRELGGFMNLLDEVNAFRIGNSFTEPIDDQKILKFLTDQYGTQAGAEATEFFQKHWTSERVKDRSVASLILAEVRRLNRMSDDEVLELAVSKNDADRINFSRLCTARYSGRRFPPKLKKALVKLAASETDAKVKLEASQSFKSIFPKMSNDSNALNASKSDAIAPNATAATTLTAQNFSTEEMVDKTIQQPDSPFAELLVKRSGELSPDQIAKLLRNALSLRDADARNSVMTIVAAGFDAQGFTEKSNPFRYHPVIREPQPNHPLVKAVESVLLEALFDGKRSEHRRSIVNFIRQRLAPQELPNFRHKVVELVAHGAETNFYDVWIAAFFLRFQSEIGEDLTWVRDLGAAVAASPDAPPRSRDFLADAIRLGLASSLKAMTYGSRSQGNLGADQRVRALTDLAALNVEQKRFLDESAVIMRKLLRDPIRKVNRSSAYAVAANPLLLMTLESELVAMLKEPASSFRPSLLELIRMTESGFLPAIDQLLQDRNYQTSHPDVVDYLKTRLHEFHDYTARPKAASSLQVNMPHRTGQPSCKDLFSNH